MRGAGTHSVEVLAIGYEPERLAVQLEPGVLLELSFTLNKHNVLLDYGARGCSMDQTRVGERAGVWPSTAKVERADRHTRHVALSVTASTSDLDVTEAIDGSPTTRRRGSAPRSRRTLPNDLRQHTLHVAAGYLGHITG